MKIKNIRERIKEYFLVNPTSKTVEALRKLNLPAGVDVEIKQ